VNIPMFPYIFFAFTVVVVRQQSSKTTSTSIATVEAES